jgi:UDP-N-acetylglucosamine 2-epimerase
MRRVVAPGRAPEAAHSFVPRGDLRKISVVQPRHDGSVRNWVSIVGARPQFIKLAPICRAIEAHNLKPGVPKIEHRVIHTGQHYDREVSGLIFEEMGIPQPYRNLSAGSGSPGVQLGRMLARMERVLIPGRTDWVVVYGDTTSTMAGALLAARLEIPLAHVEAGCRSRDLHMPEEQNRIVADHLSRLLLAPSQTAIENLHHEGIGLSGERGWRRLTVVGDLMYDALLQFLPLAEGCAKDALQEFDLKKGQYYLLTLHRAENTANAERLRGLLEAASSLDFPVLFPVHPRTRQVLEANGISVNGSIRPVAPLGYLQMLALEKHARKILTDSGGVQKEAFYLKVQCVTLREQTEWPETVELGANCVAGILPKSILAAIRSEQKTSWTEKMPYGDGTAAEKIVKELLAAGEFV